MPIPLRVAANTVLNYRSDCDNKDNGRKLKNCIQTMTRPNGVDNKERDVIAAMNVTSWVIHYHIIS